VSLGGSRSSRIAVSPIFASGTRTVERAGETSRAIATSSNPMTEIRPGTSMPRARSSRIAPTAIASFRQKTAVMPGSRSRSAAIASSPPDGMKWPGTTSSSGTGCPASA
jgi:hypothetical protein